MAARRVNVATAARLTGRSEKTIRAWLREDPCPLSVVWGPFHGGYRQEPAGPVVRGRTRWLDVAELRALDAARGGRAWDPSALPAATVEGLEAAVASLDGALGAVVARLDALEARLEARLVAGVGEPESARTPGRARLTGPTGPTGADDGPPSAPSARPLPVLPERPVASGVGPAPGEELPAGWVAVSTWCRRHDANPRTVARLMARGAFPPGRHAAAGHAWRSGPQYAVRHAFTEEEHVAACRAAARRWPARFVASCGPSCPYARELAGPAATAGATGR